MLGRELPSFFKAGTFLPTKGCPGCRNRERSKVVFNKFSFKFHRCEMCDTLYVSPRPNQDAIDTFFKTSKSTNIWYQEMFLPTLETRTLHSIDPLARWVGSIINRFRPDAKKVLDYRPKSFSIVLRDDFPIRTKPFVYRPIYIDFHNKVTELKTLSRAVFDVVIAFDDLDREADVSTFFRNISKLQKKGGLLFLTTNTASGFEYLVLGEHSPRLVLPDRLNLLSTEALRMRLEENGYKILDVSTPNKLDVEFVLEQIKRNSKIEISYFLEYLLKRRDESVLQSFQDFLQLSHLTSYCRIAAQKIR